MTAPSTTPEPIDRLLAPFREFSRNSASGGLVLIAAALVALVWANSPAAASYDELFHAPLTIAIGDTGLTESLHFWINDGLMAVFFLLVGLEIKREVLVGELASPRRAALPVAAAAGGAILPALIFLVIAGGSGDGARGWGIPMATDIAFALGVLALLGSRVPLGLRIFLAALAIADDLMAVVVIAVFYTSDLSLPALGAAASVVGALLVASRLGVRRPVVYAALGIVLWVTVYLSGVHATIAGVLLAMTIPARRRVDTQVFVERASALVAELRERTRSEAGVGAHHAALWDLEDMTEKAQAPMLRIEHALHPWVSYLIVPLFALANAGVPLTVRPTELVAEPVVVGVVLGLLLGKQIGITAATWLVVRSGIARLPAGVTWRQIYGVAWLGGIGFTMSLFIAELAYGASEALELAKIGILAASVVAAGVGLAILWLAAAPRSRDSAAPEEAPALG